MFINFLHPSLQPELQCSAIASEQYEVSNLISDDPNLSNQGFLAERFISGPVEIRVKLICPIDIKRVQLWTKVSSQKSMGIELSVKRSSLDGGGAAQYRRFASVMIPNHMDGVVFEEEGPTKAGTADNLTTFHRSTLYRGRNHENVAELVVKIFKYQYVAALKKIEIWGRPHRFCDRQTKRRVYAIWNRSQRPPKPVDVSIPSQVESNCIENQSHDPVPEHAIPDEFYDEITREMMTLPMILPCGKIVDTRTLEKFQNEEARWGRPPSDPFTGLVFTAQRKPVVATSLKLNIDSFCARNSNLGDIRTQPRRLGSREEYANTGVRISGLVDSNENLKRKLSIPSYYAEEQTSANTVVPEVQDESHKRPKLTPFLTAPETNTSSQSWTCVRCTTSTLTNLYKLPCSHIICRLCVTNCENECGKCKLSFSSKNVEKIHIFEHA